ncbi:MAG: 3-hydroxyacyl-CoA dehydrogenase NAD-binding domain-containing protein [Xanthomonadales bacterium]|nr:3-hydroxyacyl-CoA dehydrogenase NAD-binding domain-containing protein [Xanthomonadales bacterium]
MTDTIQYQVDGEGIATFTIDLPGRSMNVLTDQLLKDLEQLVDQSLADDSVKGVLITSGKDAFLAGADLTWLVQVYGSGISAEDLYKRNRTYTDILRKMETGGKPFACAINGTCLGGGLELALGCHYRVVVDHPKAVLGLPEVQVGLLPGAGGTQRLPRLIGIQPALELITQGKHVKPGKALELGFVDAVVPADQLISAARDWLLGEPDAEQPWDKKGFKVPGGAGAFHPKAVQTFMAGSAMIAEKTRHNYPAPIAIMSCVYEGTILPMDKALQIESKYFTSLMMDPVYRNMTRTLFINKGAADKLVRRPKDVERLDVKKLGMLGAGMMGAGIAFVSARAGMDVVLLDTSKEAAEKGKDYSRGLLKKAAERGRMSPEKAEQILSRIHTTDDYADLEGADLIIEAVFESREIKADVTAKTEAVIPESSIFASNTSTLPISGLAEASKRPDQFIGLHFFSPVDKMPLVEIIMGEKTSQETLAKSLDYVQKIRKTPIVVNDSRGFYTSRCFSTYVNEGQALLKDGVHPALIENAGLLAGMPVGPFAVQDEVTLDLGVKVYKQTKLDLGDDYQPPSAIDVMLKMNDDLERKGKRFGAGFYEYPEGGKKYLWPGLAEHFPPAAEQPDVEEVKTRLLYIQALETARCFEEGVIVEPADADIGSIFGWGFPPWTGGTLSFIDTVGVREFVAECDRLAAAYGPRFEPTPGLRARAESGEAFYPRADQAQDRAA